MLFFPLVLDTDGEVEEIHTCLVDIVVQYHQDTVSVFSFYLFIFSRQENGIRNRSNDTDQ